jgi:hypothetical protein
MSARKASPAESASGEQVSLHSRQAQFTLSRDAVLVRKNGVEFRSPEPFPIFTEMTTLLQSPANGGEIACTGVVVGCTGNRHMGYHVSLLFTGLSPQTEKRLSSLAAIRPD